MSADAIEPVPLPAGIEARLAEFTELVATAVASSASREQLATLAEEQAALRRVATLVARESPPAEIFAAVAEEVARLLRVEDTTIFRYEDDGTAMVVADRGDRRVPLPIGSVMPLEGDSATALVRRTGRPARIDDFSDATGPLADYTRIAGIGSTVGSPIVVDGRLWGAMIAATRSGEPMPASTESRMGQFTELVATAISNVHARSELAASRARIAAAADGERRRVVQDLHDGAQQRLVHTVLMLKLARRALDEGEERGGPALWPKRSSRRSPPSPSSANCRTASSPGRSATVGCAPVSRRWPRGCRCRSDATCPWTGSRPRSRRRRTS